MRDTVEQKFGIMIVRRIDRKKGKVQVELKTKGEGFPLGDAIVILEGWIERARKELQKPFNFDKMIFRSRRKE